MVVVMYGNMMKKDIFVFFSYVVFFILWEDRSFNFFNNLCRICEVGDMIGDIILNFF